MIERDGGAALAIHTRLELITDTQLSGLDDAEVRE